MVETQVNAYEDGEPWPEGAANDCAKALQEMREALMDLIHREFGHQPVRRAWPPNGGLFGS